MFNDNQLSSFSSPCFTVYNYWHCTFRGRHGCPRQGVTKRCRLPLLTNSALVIQVQMRGRRGVGGLSQRVQLCPSRDIKPKQTLDTNCTFIFNLWSVWSRQESDGARRNECIKFENLREGTLFDGLKFPISSWHQPTDHIFYLSKLFRNSA